MHGKMMIQLFTIAAIFKSFPLSWDNPAGFVTFSKCGDTFPHAWDKLGYEYFLHSSSRIIPTHVG